VVAQYGKLTEAEIKSLVVCDKWLASIRAALDGEVQHLAHVLATRVNQLEERYASTLPQLQDQVEKLNIKVEEHLEKMGLVWT